MIEETGDARLFFEHRPADFVPQALVVEDEIANRLGELFALPAALAPRGALALSFRRGRTRSFDRIGSCTELVRGDVRDCGSLGGRVRGIPRCPAQVSGGGVGMSRRRARLGHGDFAAHPGASVVDRLTRARVIGLNRLEEVKDVFRAHCRPEGEEPVV